MIAVSAGRVFWVHRLLGVPIMQWVGVTFVPCGIVASAATLAALTPRLLMATSFTRLIGVIVISIIVSLLTAWFFAFDRNEREFFRQNLRHLLSKMGAIVSHR